MRDWSFPGFEGFGDLCEKSRAENQGLSPSCRLRLGREVFVELLLGMLDGMSLAVCIYGLGQIYLLDMLTDFKVVW